MSHHDIAYLTAEELADKISTGELTPTAITTASTQRVHELDLAGPSIRSVIELNPDAATIAAMLDGEEPRSPLHGIPVLLKDNIDTADAMHTTAGSLALTGSTPSRDATVAAKLRNAGAVLLGKANMSEWANFRGKHSSSGWSGRGGLTLNPYSLDRTASGSSSGSAAAVVAGIVPIALGTETDGSIISPASTCGVVGVKPTVGLTSRAGVIPIAASQDSVGVFARTVRDAAIALSAIIGEDARDPATSDGAHLAGTDFAAGLNPDALQGVRLGMPNNAGIRGHVPSTEHVFEACLARLESLGAVIVRDCDFPNEDAYWEKPGAYERLHLEFRRDLNAYLAERNDPEVRTLADLIAFNERHADTELQWFDQYALERSEEERGDLEALNARLNKLSRDNGIDYLLKEHRLDALIAPSSSPAPVNDLVNGEKRMGGCTSISAIAGYPIVSVPAGLVHGLPVGLSFLGTAWSEARLLELAYAWEHHTRMFRQPTFAADITQVPGIPHFELP